jgi:DNA polymerase-3 subunit gamma/tau
MEGLQTLADQLGLETILSCVQVIDQALVRMQSSLHARTLLEGAAVRVCNLEHLDSVGDLVKQLASVDGSTTTKRPAAGASTKPPLKKNEVVERLHRPAAAETAPAPTPTPPASPVSDPASSVSSVTANSLVAAGGIAAAAQALDKQPAASASITAEAADASVVEKRDSVATPPTPTQPASLTSAGTQEIEKNWKQALSALDAEGDLTADMASQYERLDWKSPECLVVTMTDSYNSDLCSKQDRREKLESALATAAGRSIRLDFVASASAKKQAMRGPRMTRNQQIRELQQHAYVRQTMDLFDAEVTDFYKR